MGKNIFHTYKINSLYFLFIDKHFELIKSINSHNQTVLVVTHVLVVVFEDFLKKYVLALFYCFQEYFIVES